MGDSHCNCKLWIIILVFSTVATVCALTVLVVLHKKVQYCNIAEQPTVTVTSVFKYGVRAPPCEELPARLKVAYIFSGQLRSSPFSTNVSQRSPEILQSYREFLGLQDVEARVYIFNSETVDCAQVGNVFPHYSIHYTTDDTELEGYLCNYRKFVQQNARGLTPYENSIHQHFKIMKAYELYKADVEFSAEVVVRLRMDAQLTRSLLPDIISVAAQKGHKLVGHWDFVAVGSPEVMQHYCTAIHNGYGRYTFQTTFRYRESPPMMSDYFQVDPTRWTLAPERQLFEHMFRFCQERDLVANDVLESQPSCELVRL